MQTPSPSPLTLDQWETWRLCADVHRAIERSLDARLSTDAKIGLTDFNLLATLGSAPNNTMQMGDVASALSITRSGASRAVTRLVMLGYVDRIADREDRRAAHAQLTDEGRRMLKWARDEHIKALSDLFFSSLDSEDVDALRRIISKISAPLTAQPAVPEKAAS